MQKKKINYIYAFLVGAVLRNNSRKQIEDQMRELELLALTAGAKTLSTDIQTRNIIDPATFIGKGKIEQIKKQAYELGCNLIILNNDITPSQLKNIQIILGKELKVIDRTGIILDIFTQHARSKESKTQVELAKLEYFLPRLTHQWTHLERQMGGVGTRAGAGETQIEVDRRLIRNRISKLKSELNKIEKQRNTQKQKRKSFYKIALVGYTNAGKSTLMNTLTKADVLVQNQLFATLDTTTRKLDINTGMPILISDTVGFIRNLPHNLIASFRSTLGEIRDVDMLIKVFDASSDNIHDHITTVEKVLTDINIQDKANIVVMNKIDLIKDSQQLEGLKTRFKNSAFISCYNKTGITTLLKTLQDTIRSKYYHHVFHLTYKQTNLLDKIYTSTKVLKKISDYNGIKLEVEGSRESIDQIRQILEN